MQTGFRILNSGYVSDVDDYLVRREYFNDGTLWTWGRDSYGVLGNGTTTSRSSPGTTVGGGTNWKQVSAQATNLVAIKTDGTLWTCGYNSAGALGDGTTTSRTSPVTTAEGGTNWKQASAGLYYTTAIKTDGSLWTWGNNNSGQLGDNTTTNRSSPGTTSGGGTNWKQVFAGVFFTTAIKTDGSLWTWGNNNSGQLGDNTTTNRSSPGTTSGGGTNWKQVSCGRRHTAAIKTDGTLWTWGDDSYGQLGDNTTAARSSPGTTSGGGTNWKQVSCGRTHTAAIKTDGTLWTCGYNIAGQLGDETTTARSSPGTTAGGGTNWKQVACGFNFTLAIKTDGTLWTCGYNNRGQLGDNTTTARSSLGTVVGGGTNWKTVDASSYSYVSAAITDLSI
jgi:alpha-tubulin suppressor-like RCC1 family protein